MVSRKFAIAYVLLCASAAWLLAAPGRGDDDREQRAGARSISAILVGRDRVTADLLERWKQRGATAVVVPLDETIERQSWAKLADLVSRQGLALYAWVEVARSPALADAHPDWMASPGGHHDDWRRRFPNAPKAGKGEVIKTWPWVPIGYAPAFDAHRERVLKLLDTLPGTWAGVFLNDLQAGPSSCGCGNDQCRWALDYGSPTTAPHTPGDDAAARLVAAIQAKHKTKQVIPVWVTECEQVDLPSTKGGTGLCGNVPCAKNDCWPRYARNWNPLVKAATGPIALAAWPATFGRDRETWIETGLGLFRNPPRGGDALPAERTVAVLEGAGRTDDERAALTARVQKAKVGWVLALDAIDQTWQPRVVAIEAKSGR